MSDSDPLVISSMTSIVPSLSTTAPIIVVIEGWRREAKSLTSAMNLFVLEVVDLWLDWSLGPLAVKTLRGVSPPAVLPPDSALSISIDCSIADSLSTHSPACVSITGTTEALEVTEAAFSETATIEDPAPTLVGDPGGKDPALLLRATPERIGEPGTHCPEVTGEPPPLKASPLRHSTLVLRPPPNPGRPLLTLISFAKLAKSRPELVAPPPAPPCILLTATSVPRYLPAITSPAAPSPKTSGGSVNTMCFLSIFQVASAALSLKYRYPRATRHSRSNEGIKMETSRVPLSMHPPLISTDPELQTQRPRLSADLPAPSQLFSLIPIRVGDINICSPLMNSSSRIFPV
mmetsp:Transcript_9649/g.15114  ORF Transcript_9649/g.15114 Transcript_9649/m.15114 type:complete len:347 (-) Transcript_9649:1355-2395(-)